MYYNYARLATHKLEAAVRAVLLVLLLGMIAHQSYGQCFQPAYSLKLKSEPGELVTADFNRDGKSDFAVITMMHTLNVFLSTAQGSFGPAAEYQPSGGKTLNERVIAAGDFNGDGYADLAVGANKEVFTDTELLIFVNNGKGSFAAPVAYTISSNPDAPRIVGLKVGDLNGDNRPDLFSLSTLKNNAVVLLNTGNGTFSPPVLYDTGGNAYSVVSSDVNMDGKPDLIANSFPGNAKVSVLLNRGDGSFGTPITYTTFYDTVQLAAGDVNGDGKPDIVLKTLNDFIILVLLNQGGGTFSDPVMTYVGRDFSELVLNDVDQDGKLDVVTSRWDRLAVLPGKGDGTFGFSRNFSVDTGANSVAVADFNGDNKPDLITASYGNKSVSILYSCPTVVNTPPQPVGTPNLTITIGVPFAYTANAFTDAETPNSLTYAFTTSGSPSAVLGLEFDPSTRRISGTPQNAGVMSVTLTATDADGLSASTTFTITSLSQASNLSITGVTAVSCQTLSATQRQVSFTPLYSGLSGEALSFSVVNELSPTSQAAPYTLQLYTDNPVITLVAQQGKREARYVYNWLAACTSSSQPTGLSITGVTTVSCQVVSATERRLSFMPQYSGQTSEPISFSVANELSPTTQPGPYTLQLYMDNPTITLVAQQAAQQASFRYNWLASCPGSSGSRQRIEPQQVLQVSVLGNPVRDEHVSFEVQGANAQPLQLRLLTPQGQVITQRQVSSPQAIERHQLSMAGQPGGLFLLQVSTPTQSRVIKLLKAN
ncbi:FG-GAP-like repeat-containing protein [Spirosoma pomorum]